MRSTQAVVAQLCRAYTDGSSRKNGQFAVLDASSLVDLSDQDVEAIHREIALPGTPVYIGQPSERFLITSMDRLCPNRPPPGAAPTAQPHPPNVAPILPPPAGPDVAPAVPPPNAAPAPPAQPQAPPKAHAAVEIFGHDGRQTYVGTNGGFLLVMSVPFGRAYTTDELSGKKGPLSPLRAVQSIVANSTKPVVLVLPARTNGQVPLKCGPLAELYAHFADPWEWLREPPNKKPRLGVQVVESDDLPPELHDKCVVWITAAKLRVPPGKWQADDTAPSFLGSFQDMGAAETWRVKFAMDDKKRIEGTLQTIEIKTRDFERQFALRDKSGNFCGFWLQGDRKDKCGVGDPSSLVLGCEALTELAVLLWRVAHGDETAPPKADWRCSRPFLTSVPQTGPVLYVAPPGEAQPTGPLRIDGDGNAIPLTPEEAAEFARIAWVNPLPEPAVERKASSLTGPYPLLKGALLAAVSLIGFYGQRTTGGPQTAPVVPLAAEGHRPVVPPVRAPLTVNDPPPVVSAYVPPPPPPPPVPVPVPPTQTASEAQTVPQPDTTSATGTQPPPTVPQPLTQTASSDTQPLTVDPPPTTSAGTEPPTVKHTAYPTPVGFEKFEPVLKIQPPPGTQGPEARALLIAPSFDERAIRRFEGLLEGFSDIVTVSDVQRAEKALSIAAGSRFGTIVTAMTHFGGKCHINTPDGVFPREKYPNIFSHPNRHNVVYTKHPDKAYGIASLFSMRSSGTDLYFLTDLAGPLYRPLKLPPPESQSAGDGPYRPPAMAVASAPSVPTQPASAAPPTAPPAAPPVPAAPPTTAPTGAHKGSEHQGDGTAVPDGKTAVPDGLREADPLRPQRAGGKVLVVLSSGANQQQFGKFLGGFGQVEYAQDAKAAEIVMGSQDIDTLVTVSYCNSPRCQVNSTDGSLSLVRYPKIFAHPHRYHLMIMGGKEINRAASHAANFYSCRNDGTSLLFTTNRAPMLYTLERTPNEVSTCQRRKLE